MSRFNSFENMFKNLRLENEVNDGFMIGQMRFKYFFFEDQIDLEQKLNAETKPFSEGLLFEKLPSDTRRWLEQNKISYMTENGYAALFLEGHKTLIRPYSIKASKQRALLPFPKSKTEITPSRIINPRGMSIVDTIIRLTGDEVRELSGVAFTKKYNLAQPSLSKIMSAAGAKNLFDMRKIAGQLDKKWWLDALEGPRTGRGMTPFYEQSQSYRLHDKDLNRKQLAEWFKKVLETYKETVFPGPLDVVKSIGAIADKTVSFWVDPKVLPALKREFRLVPTRSGDEVHCSIATPKTSFQKESILTNAVDTDVRGLPAECLSLNLIRVLWDLTHADSRTRESRGDLLELLLNAI